MQLEADQAGLETPLLDRLGVLAARHGAWGDCEDGFAVRAVCLASLIPPGRYQGSTGLACCATVTDIGKGVPAFYAKHRAGLVGVDGGFQSAAFFFSTSEAGCCFIKLHNSMFTHTNFRSILWFKVL